MWLRNIPESPGNQQWCSLSSDCICSGLLPPTLPLAFLRTLIWPQLLRTTHRRGKSTKTEDLHLNSWNSLAKALWLVRAHSIFHFVFFWPLSVLWKTSFLPQGTPQDPLKGVFLSSHHALLIIINTLARFFWVLTAKALWKRRQCSLLTIHSRCEPRVKEGGWEVLPI